MTSFQCNSKKLGCYKKIHLKKRILFINLFTLGTSASMAIDFETVLTTISLSTDDYLTHHWPFSDEQMVDIIGNVKMFQGNLTSFTFDRFGCPNAALALNGGWTQVASGVFFDTPQFTISAWIYPQNVSTKARLIDFGDDNVIFTIDNNWYFQICGTPSWGTVNPSQMLISNSWQMLTATFDGVKMSVYFNGVLKSTSQYNHTMSQNLVRTKCYLGKSNWAQDGYSWSFVDDLRFYNKSLTQTEIIELINKNETSENLVMKLVLFINCLK